MAAYRDTKHSARTNDSWIPLEALAPDLSARLEAFGPGESAGSAALRGGGVPVALYLVGACVIVLALLVALTGPSVPAFAVPRRAALLAIAGLFAGAMIASRRLTRQGRFAPPVFHVGPTTLLTVHAGHLRVLPAEGLDVTAEQIANGGEIVDDGVHDPSWLDALMAARATAQTGPDAVTRDPFRSVLTSRKRVTRGAVFAARLRTIGIAALVGAVGGIVVEVVPFGIVGRVTVRREDEARARAMRDERARRTAEHLRAQRDAEAARARAAERQQRALSGSESDARAWLRQAGILDDPELKARVQRRLDGFCDQRFPPRSEANDEQLLFMTMLRRACSDPEQSLYYMVNDAYATEGARLLSRHLAMVSEWLGVPQSVQPQPMQSPDGVHPYVEIEAVAIGEATTRPTSVAIPDPLRPTGVIAPYDRVQPMRMTVRLHDRDGDLLGVPAFTERVQLVEHWTRGE